MNDILSVTPFQKELRDIFTKRDNDGSSMRDIGEDDIIKGTQTKVIDKSIWEPTKLNNTRQQLFENINLGDINMTLNKVVLHHLMNFCSLSNPTDVSAFNECFKIYHSMSPRHLGRLGCVWATSDTFQWFENFYLIKIFVCRPGIEVDQHFHR